MTSNKPLSGLHLKIIACAAMLTDHACKVVVPGSLLTYRLIQTVGRVAFPLFAFLLLEGFLHTRSRKKYALNLLIIALISEIPFNLALHQTWFYPLKQNTCFTLLLGLLMMICLEKIEQMERPEKILYMIATAAGFAVLFWALKVDYGWIACLVFFACYMLKYQQPWFTALIISTILFAGFQTPGVYLCIVPLLFYNKKRGSVSAAAKYLFYAFYPAHLSILAAIGHLI